METVTCLEDCLPAPLRGPTTSITRIGAGLSGAGVYRVEANGKVFVLKIAGEQEPIASWRTKLAVKQRAADVGLAPPIVHADEARRAVVSELVVDRSFPALFFDPRTRAQAITLLGTTLRRLHALPLPPELEGKEPRAFLAEIWAVVGAPGFELPDFVREAVARVLPEAPPPDGARAAVLSHNDVNPSNLVFDGEHLLLLDWETAGPNDPFYDLAAIAVFLRMDDATCLALLAAYDGHEAPAVPARLLYFKRVVAVLCGTAFLHLARQSGYAGASGETLESTPGLAEFYQRMRAGAVSVATGEGQWWFGLALVKAGCEA
jgi:aminoglycoside phosphotransferase (APT) family kinase protein